MNYTRNEHKKVDERRKWKNVSMAEGRKIYKRLRNELKDPYKNPRRNILRLFVTRWLNFKE
jgi:hypothetical protein